MTLDKMDKARNLEDKIVHIQNILNNINEPECVNTPIKRLNIIHTNHYQNLDFTKMWFNESDRSFIQGTMIKMFENMIRFAKEDLDNL